MRGIIAISSLVLAIGCGGASGGGLSDASQGTALVEVNLSQYSLSVGQTATASAIGYDSFGHATAIAALSWGSSAPAVASVSAGGVITALSAGNAVISGTFQGVRGERTITVVGSAISSISVSAATTTITSGTIVQASAFARDQNGNLVGGRSFLWSTSSPNVATVSQAGTITGLSAGTVSIAARDVATNLVGVMTMTVLPRPRPAGSLLSVGVDSAIQYGSPLFASTLGVIDTSRSGVDFRIGMIGHAGVPFVAPILRADFPQLSALSECPNGDVYGTSYATSDAPVQLWRIDPHTGGATSVASLTFIAGTVLAMACESTSRIFMAETFANLGTLYAVNQAALTYQTVASSGTDVYLGLAVSGTGTLYATTQDRFNTVSPYPELLVTINTFSGARTPVGANQQRHAVAVRQLAFRSSRLLGIQNSSQLVEVDTQTGATSFIRSVSVP